MFCSESCEHGVHATSSGKVLRFAPQRPPRLQPQQEPQRQQMAQMQLPQQQPQLQQLPQLQMPQQRPQHLTQQQTLKMNFPIQLNENNIESDMEPRVGMCVVTERPEGLSIDCSVPIPNSFNLDAYQQSVAGSANRPYFPMIPIHQQNEGFCMALAPPPTPPPMALPTPQCNNTLPGACTCFDSMAIAPVPYNSNATSYEPLQNGSPILQRCCRMERPLAWQHPQAQQTPVTYCPALSQQQPVHNDWNTLSLQVAAPASPTPSSPTQFIVPDQGMHYCNILPIQSPVAQQEQQQSMPGLCQLQAFGLIPVNAQAAQPPASPECLKHQQQPQSQLLRFDFPCVLTELRTENCCQEPGGSAELPFSDCSGSGNSSTGRTSAPQTSTASTMSKSKSVYCNKKTYGSVQSSVHCAGNVCMKCGNRWHYPRCSNYCWHPGVLRLSADKRR